MKDTTLTELLDLMKAYAERHSIRIHYTMYLEGDGVVMAFAGNTLFKYKSYTDLVDKLKK